MTGAMRDATVVPFPDVDSEHLPCGTYSADEVAERLGVGRSMVYECAKDGSLESEYGITALQLGGKKRFPKWQVEQWLIPPPPQPDRRVAVLEQLLEAVHDVTAELVEH